MKWLQVTPAAFQAPPRTLDDMDAFFAARPDKALNRDDVVLESEIGAGEFGSVYNGYLRRGANKLLIAIKMLKDSNNPVQKVKFLQEAAIMAQFKHPKIVSLVGLVTQGEPVLICLEFMELGSLRAYLKSELVFEKLSDADLVRMACDVCSGMHYLAESGFVHRDLAARNVLVNRNFVYVLGFDFDYQACFLFWSDCLCCFRFFFCCFRFFLFFFSSSCFFFFSDLLMVPGVSQLQGV